MTAWSTQQLAEQDQVHQIRVAGRRADGSSRTLTTVWQVVVDGNFYIRSMKGPAGQWFRGIARHFEGFVDWGEGPQPARFTLDPSHDDEIDAAYIDKYGRSSATDSVTSQLARQTTLRVDPADRRTT